MNLWHLRKLEKINFLKKFIKLIFSLWYYHGRIIKIRRGPLRNMQWVCHKEAQFWLPLGLYEKETAAWLVNHISSGNTFVDIGANFGYFTLLGSK